MKTVKSLSDLKQSALSQGATVSVGGRQFNAGGEQGRVVAMPKPSVREEPAAEPTRAAPVETAAPVNNITVDMQPVADAQQHVGELIAQALARMPQPTAPIRAWEFTVSRDANGYLKTITATAKE
jgi:hypothetical protein